MIDADLSAHLRKLQTERGLNKSFCEKGLNNPVVQYITKLSVKETSVCEELFEATKKMVSKFGDSYGPGLGAPEVVQFGKNFIHLIGAKKILDVGTFTAYSAMAFAEALPEDGHVLSMDIQHLMLDKVRPIIDKYPNLSKKVEFRLGCAKKILDELLSNGEAGQWDFAFIDADKTSYPDYYEKCVQLLRSGGVIIVDDAFWFGTVIDDPEQSPMSRAIAGLNKTISEDPRVHNMLLDLGDGTHIAFKK